MITRRLIEQDLELQRCAATPQEMKPRFNWSDMATSHQGPSTRIMVQVGNEQSDLSIAKIAETVGRAVTDLALSRKQDDIFNDTNRQLVANIVKSVTEILTTKANNEETDGTVLLSAAELTTIIEMALVRQNAHDVAKSLLIRRKTAHARRDISMDSTEKPLCRVIRRNGEVVAWDPNKIEIAVRSSFLSLGMDSTPAKEISDALTDRIARSGQEFMRIEDLQDRVQEELMRQGHYKVAESYILYRAHRAQLRQFEEEETVRDYESTQDSMIVLKRADGSSELWDGVDLRRRVEFALTGLDLCLSQDEIEHELRRAFFNEMTESDLRKTVILNAKSAHRARRRLRPFLRPHPPHLHLRGGARLGHVRDGIEKLPPSTAAPSAQPRSRGRDRALSPRLLDSISTSSPPRSIRPPTSTSTTSASRRSTTVT
jgi:ribonucleoside-diphosphate reductase alpha chain